MPKVMNPLMIHDGYATMAREGEGGKWIGRPPRQKRQSPHSKCILGALARDALATGNQGE